MKITLTYGRSNSILANWDQLDELRNDEVLHAFQIRNTLENTFRPYTDAERAVQKRKEKIVTEITEEITERKKSDDPELQETVANTQIKGDARGGTSIEGMPEDLSEKYKDDFKEIKQEIEHLYEKEETIEIDPLLPSELKKYDCLCGEVLRHVHELVDLSAKEIEEEDEEEEEKPSKKTKKSKKKSSD